MNEDKGMAYTSAMMEILNKLIIDGYWFIEDYNQSHNKAIRILKARGHNIKSFSTYFVRGKNCRSTPKFRVVYYPDKAQAVVNKIFDKYPELKGRPQIYRKIEVPILKNLHSLASNSIERFKENQRENLKKWKELHPNYDKEYRER